MTEQDTVTGGGLANLDVSGIGGTNKITTGGGSFVAGDSSSAINNAVKTGSAATDSVGGINYSGPGAIRTGGSSVDGFTLGSGSADTIKTGGI